MIVYSSELCQLMAYGSGSVVGIKGSGNGDGGSGVGNNDYYLKSTNLVSDSLSDLYSKLNIFFCKG